MQLLGLWRRGGDTWRGPTGEQKSSKPKPCCCEAAVLTTAPPSLQWLLRWKKAKLSHNLHQKIKLLIQVTQPNQQPDHGEREVYQRGSTDLVAALLLHTLAQVIEDQSICKQLLTHCRGFPRAPQEGGGGAFRRWLTLWATLKMKTHGEKMQSLAALAR